MVDHAYEGLRAMCSVDFNCIALDQFGVRSAFFFLGETKPECLLACFRFDLTGSACLMLSGHTVQILGLRASVCMHAAFYSG
jgi:hypothetical protein